MYGAPLSEDDAHKIVLALCEFCQVLLEIADDNNSRGAAPAAEAKPILRVRRTKAPRPPRPV